MQGKRYAQNIAEPDRALKGVGVWSRSILRGRKTALKNSLARQRAFRQKQRPYILGGGVKGISSCELLKGKA